MLGKDDDEAVLNASITGETHHLLRNVDEMRAKSADPQIRRLLGVEGDLGRKLELPNSWAYSIIKQVGNYGEIYNRNVGPDTPLKLERGLNQLWIKGGILYAPPMR